MRDWSDEVWTTSQLAEYLGVSQSFIRKRIRQGHICTLKGGAYEEDWKGWLHYRIAKAEVVRVIWELPLPPVGETLEQRLNLYSRHWEKHLPVVKTICDEILNLDLETVSESVRVNTLRDSARRPRRYRRSKRRAEPR